MGTSIFDLPPQVLWMILEARLADNLKEYMGDGTLYVIGLIGDPLYFYDNNPQRGRRKTLSCLTIHLMTMLRLVCKAFRKCIYSNTILAKKELKIIKRSYICRR
jgi:hypothetical protein